MEQDTESALGALAPQALRKVVINKDLANNFKAALWIIADTARARGKRLEGIEAGPVTMTENRIRVKMIWPGVLFTTARTMSADAGGLAEKISKDEYLLWVFLRANPGLVEMLKGIIQKMDAYASDKSTEFHRLNIAKGIMDHEDHIVLFMENPAIEKLKL